MNWEELLRLMAETNPNLYRWVMTGQIDNRYYNALNEISPDLYAFVMSKRQSQQGQNEWVNNPMKYTQEAYNQARNTRVFMPDAPLPDRWTEPGGYYTGRDIVVNSKQDSDYVLSHELGHRFDDLNNITFRNPPLSANQMLGRELRFEQAANIYKDLFNSPTNYGWNLASFPGMFGNPYADAGGGKWGGVSEFYAALGAQPQDIPEPIRRYYPQFQPRAYEYLSKSNPPEDYFNVQPNRGMEWQHNDEVEDVTYGKDLSAVMGASGNFSYNPPPPPHATPIPFFSEMPKQIDETPYQEVPYTPTPPRLNRWDREG